MYHSPPHDVVEGRVPQPFGACVGTALDPSASCQAAGEQPSKQVCTPSSKPPGGIVKLTKNPLRCLPFEERSYWIPGSYAPTLSKNRNAFLRLLKNKGLKNERMRKVGWYAIDKSTTLESNKSPCLLGP